MLATINVVRILGVTQPIRQDDGPDFPGAIQWLERGGVMPHRPAISASVPSALTDSKAACTRPRRAVLAAWTAIAPAYPALLSGEIKAFIRSAPSFAYQQTALAMWSDLRVANGYVPTQVS